MIKKMQNKDQYMDKNGMELNMIVEWDEMGMEGCFWGRGG